MGRILTPKQVSESLQKQSKTRELKDRIHHIRNWEIDICPFECDSCDQKTERDKAMQREQIAELEAELKMFEE